MSTRNWRIFFLAHLLPSFDDGVHAAEHGFATQPCFVVDCSGKIDRHLQDASKIILDRSQQFMELGVSLFHTHKQIGGNCKRELLHNRHSQNVVLAIPILGKIGLRQCTHPWYEVLEALGTKEHGEDATHASVNNVTMMRFNKMQCLMVADIARAIRLIITVQYLGHRNLGGFSLWFLRNLVRQRDV